MSQSLTAALFVLPLSEAMKVLASINSLDHLPDSFADPVQDLADAALACFPEAQAAFWELMDAQGVGPGPETFNYIADAYRLLAPAVASARYPFVAKNGNREVTLDADTPMLVMLPKVQAMELDTASQVAAFPTGSFPSEETKMAVAA